MSKVSALNQPKPFYLIFLLEIWERYGFYGIQALIVLYMVKYLGYTDKIADNMFAAFAALVFLLPAVGGYIGDNILGTKRTILLGMIVLTVGYAALSLHAFSHYISLPLAIIAVGNGLFKANPSSLLSKVYEQQHRNPDSGFTLYYMAINVGSFLSMTISPIISDYYGWSAGFFASCMGLLIALVTFFSLKNLIRNYGSKPDFAPVNMVKLAGVLIFTLALVIFSNILLSHQKVMAILLGSGMAMLFIFYFYQMSKADRSEVNGMLLFMILFVQAIAFWVLYFQMPTSLNLYALRNVNHSILGIPIEPASFQALNPIWIVVLSPVLAYIYQRLTNNKGDFSLPTKFAMGTLLAAVSFLILPIGGLFAHHGVVNSGWLVFSYFFQSIGELLVSALGLSLVSRYIPQRLNGFVMGLWFMCTSIASMISGVVAGLADVPKNITDPVASLPIYNHLFIRIGLITALISLVMFLLIPLIKRFDQPRAVRAAPFVEAA